MEQIQDVPLDALEQYMREVRRTPPLTGEEEAQLFLCMEQGIDAQQARTRLIAGYQPLVLALAKRFMRNCKALELLDLVQEGNIALLQALAKYDRRKEETSFGTFAFAWLRISMLTACWRYEGTIRLPWHKARALRQMKAVNDALYGLLGREPTICEIASEMATTEGNLLELLVLREQQQVVSLDTSIDDDEGMTLADVIEDTSLSTDDDLSSLEEVLEHLNECERAVILVRYGFGDGRAYTQQETARLLGMGLNEVQELDRRARIRLRRVLLQAS
jgi:RNA polymerase primary sigma factor